MLDAQNSVALGGSDRWRLDGALTLAADMPRGFGACGGSIFEAGPALLSNWSLDVTRRAQLPLTPPPEMPRNPS